ncbi:MAG: hypothetical protein J7L61_03220, partial [Thermoplasmata archaeon]|nr:hypothetical protein [Thermoplasmata archaeon]
MKKVVFVLMGLMIVGALNLPVNGETYTGTVTLSDGTVEKNYFEPSDTIYYDITVLEDGAPLQQKDIHVDIVGDSEGWVWGETLTTDDYGQASGDWPSWGIWDHPIDRYILYVNYTNATDTTTVVTTVFRVYNPVPWTASVETRDENGNPTSFFSEDQEVYVYVEVEDQYGNPFDGDVYYYVSHEGDPFINHFWFGTDAEGTAEFYINPGWYYSDTTDPPIYGEYLINITNEASETIGNATFVVISLDISIQPEKMVYAQGDEIDIHVETSLEEGYTVNITNQTGAVLQGASWNVLAGSEMWTRTYVLPSNAPDGDYTINVWQNGVLMGQFPFQMQKFSIMMGLDRAAYVPGQTGVIHWMAVDNHNGGPMDVEVDATLTYQDTDYYTPTKDIKTVNGSSGSISFTVPQDARVGYHNHEITLRGDDGAGHTSETTFNLPLGHLDIGVDTDRAAYKAGETVLITVHARVQGHPDAGVPGVEITAEILYEGSQVYEWTGTSDGDGEASFFYQIPDDAEEGVYTVNVTGELQGNADEEDNDMHDYTVDNTPTVSVMLYPRADPAVAGTTLIIDYYVEEDGAPADAEVRYVATMDNDVIAEGFGSNGRIEIPLPEGREGYLMVAATAYTSSDSTGQNVVGVDVVKAMLELSSDRGTYRPGETITFTYVIVGDTAQDARYVIEDENGNTISEGTISGDSFTYTTPEEKPYHTYTAVVYVTCSSGAYTAVEAVAPYRGYIVEYTLDKNSYKPGDTITITYHLRPIGDPITPPEGFHLSMGIVGHTPEEVWTDSADGTLTYTLPPEISDGQHLFQLFIWNQANTNDFQSITVDSDAGPLAYGTVAGMTGGAFLALLIAIIALIIGILVAMKMGGRRRETRPPRPPA